MMMMSLIFSAVSDFFFFGLKSHDGHEIEMTEGVKMASRYERRNDDVTDCRLSMIFFLYILIEESRRTLCSDSEMTEGVKIASIDFRRRNRFRVN